MSHPDLAKRVKRSHAILRPSSFFNGYATEKWRYSRVPQESLTRFLV